MTELNKTERILSGVAHLYDWFFLLDDTAVSGQVFHEEKWETVEGFNTWCKERFSANYSGDDNALFMQRISSEMIVKALSVEDEYMLEYSVTEDDRERRKCMKAFICDEKSICVCVEDVTSKYKKEQSREEIARESLKVAQQAFVAMERLGANVNEEIRRPVLQAVDMLELSLGKKSEESHEYIKQAIMTLEKYANTLDGILSFSKMEKGEEVKEEDVILTSDFLTDLIQMVQVLTEATEDVVSITDGTEKITVFVSNYICLKQMLGNAFMMMLLKSAADTVEAVLKIDTPKDAGELMLSFRISAYETEETFMQSTCMKFVHNLAVYMFGNVEFSAGKDGERALLSIHVPVKRADKEQQRKAKLSARMRSSVMDKDFSAFRALVVDDDKISREIMTFKLKQFGLYVDEVTGSEEAIQKLIDSPGWYYQIVFTKMMFPGRSGLDFTMELRRQKRRDLNDITIVAVTSNPMKEKRITALEHGMDYHLALPLNDYELKEILLRELENIGPEEGYEKFGFRIIK